MRNRYIIPPKFYKEPYYPTMYREDRNRWLREVKQDKKEWKNRSVA